MLAAAAADGVHAVVLDAETIPFVDVTAAKMLDELAGDLRRRGVRLLIARDVGQVRDVLGHAAADPSLQHVYPSVQAAVDAATAPAQTRRRCQSRAAARLALAGEAGPPSRDRRMAGPRPKELLHEQSRSHRVPDRVTAENVMGTRDDDRKHAIRARGCGRRHPRREGKVKLHQSNKLAAGGAVGGALWGGLIGLIFFVPLFGMAIGAATGAATGALTDVGVDDNFMKDLGEKLQPGGAAVIVLILALDARQGPPRDRPVRRRGHPDVARRRRRAAAAPRARDARRRGGLETGGGGRGPSRPPRLADGLPARMAAARRDRGRGRLERGRPAGRRLRPDRRAAAARPG